MTEEEKIQSITEELRRMFPNSRIGEIYRKPNGTYHVTMMDLPPDLLEQFDKCTELTNRKESK